MKSRESNARSVTLLLPFPVFGAAEDYFAVLACGLIKRGWSVRIVLPEAIHDAVGIRSAASAGAEIIPLAGSELNNPMRLRAALKKRPPSGIVHVNHFFLPGIAAAISARAGSRTVVTIHTPALRVKYSLKGRALARWATPQVSEWIVLSKRNADLLAGQMQATKDRISIVFPGLPPERFGAAVSPKTRRIARNILGLSDDAFVVGTVGRIARQKRHDILIQANAIALRRIENLQLVIVGEGELRPQIEALAEAQLPGRVMLAGSRENVPELLPAFDIFCLSSDFEGLPFALLEAMAMGLPIVATDVQGSGEAIADGAEGLLTPAGIPGKLADAIVRLESDPVLAAALGERARTRFFREFTDDVMVERTIGVYEQILKKQAAK